MIEGLDHVSCEERQSQLGLLSLEKRNFGGTQQQTEIPGPPSECKETLLTLREGDLSTCTCCPEGLWRPQIWRY